MTVSKCLVTIALVIQKVRIHYIRCGVATCFELLDARPYVSRVIASGLIFIQLA